MCRLKRDRDRVGVCDILCARATQLGDDPVTQQAVGFSETKFLRTVLDTGDGQVPEIQPYFRDKPAGEHHHGLIHMELKRHS